MKKFILLAIALAGCLSARAEPVICISKWDEDHYIVSAFQQASNTLEMSFTDDIGATWALLAYFPYSAVDRWNFTLIPSHWNPNDRMFVRAVNMPTKL